MVGSRQCSLKTSYLVFESDKREDTWIRGCGRTGGCEEGADNSAMDI